MTAARKLKVTLGHAKPLRIAPPARTFVVYEKDTGGAGYGDAEVGECTGTDPQLACAAWCKENGYGGKRRHDFYARELPARREETEAEEDAREARLDAIGDQIDEERDAQRWERDEDEYADR